MVTKKATCYVCEIELVYKRFAFSDPPNDCVWFNQVNLNKYKQKKVKDSEAWKYGFHVECLREFIGDEMFFDFFEEK